MRYGTDDDPFKDDEDQPDPCGMCGGSGLMSVLGANPGEWSVFECPCKTPPTRFEREDPVPG